MVVAQSGAKLLNPVAHASRRTKIQRCSFYRIELTARDQVVIDIQRLIGKDFDHVILGRAATCSRQVPIAMVSQVDMGSSICGGRESHRQFVAIIEAIVGDGCQRAWEAFGACRADVREPNSGMIVALIGLSLPQHMVKRYQTAVQVMLARIDRYLIRFAVDRKFSIRDPITKTTDG